MDEKKTIGTGPEAFCAAVWEWLRGEAVFEPVPEQYGVGGAIGKMLRRQCEIDFNSKQVKR